jgi:hypothetical protein
MGDDVGVPLMRPRGLTPLERISMLRNLAPLRKGRRPRYSFARGNSEPKRLGAGSRATTHGPRPTGHAPRTWRRGRLALSAPSGWHTGVSTAVQYKFIHHLCVV